MANEKLIGAVQLALAAGAAGTMVPVDAPLAQEKGAQSTEGVPLEEIVVTGSRIRRVDAETASPVFVLDAATIAQSGATTMGDLVNKIPSIAGQAVNPALNNGGGFGESYIELRGLGAQRTLILLDGRRINLPGGGGTGGQSVGVDVNMLPIDMIDHVEVLKEGAGAVYGSDAVAGVVNFISRKTVDGLMLTGDWGETTKHDARHHSVGMVFGGSTDKLSFQIGGDYNQQDELNMGQRQWSQYALYLYSGVQTKGGSSRTPTGRIYLDAALQAQFNCPKVSAGSVTRIAGAAGSSLADYRCWAGSSDKFNFQPYNLNLTPQERGALFTKVNYQINDYVEAYADVVYNHTHSGFQLAPLPFDALADNIIISKDSIYNPFGYDFGGGNNPNFALRMSALGPRRSDSVGTSELVYTGLKGKILNTGWNYDGNLSYGRLDQTANIAGYLLFSALTNAVGPSFIDPVSGLPTCGTPAAPIDGCTPANIFNLTAPGQAAALNTISAVYDTQYTYRSKGFNLDANGPITKLPGGDMLGSVGVAYTGLEGQFVTSTLTQTQPPFFLNCQISQEACGGNSAGHYNVKEIYGEVFAPLVSGAPGVYSLNFDAGVRYSNYSLFGNTTKGQFKLEYRPIHDLLLRGTYAQIFRAPTINDISAAGKINSPTLNDPCNGFTGVGTALYPNLPAACVGVPTNGTFQEPQNQITGKQTSNPNLKPETGDVKTFGFVYDSTQLAGFSASADYWDYTVKDLLTQLDPNYAIQQCATTAATEFCSLAHRYLSGPNQGLFQVMNQPTFNLGELKTHGIDFGVRYTTKNTSVGKFLFTVDWTHLMSYQNTPAPGAATQEIAGTYNKQFGFYAKNRATANIGWNYEGAEALLTTRYIDGVDIPLTNFDGTKYLGWHLGSVVYFDLTAGYTIKQTNTKIRAGMLNVADKTPPIAGINSFGAGSSVTDIFTYDTVGRRYYLGFTQSF